MGAVDFSVILGELANHNRGSGSHTALTLAGWLFKEGHKAHLSLALFPSGTYHGVDNGNHNEFVLGVVINKRLPTPKPNFLCQPSASRYSSYTSGYYAGDKSVRGAQPGLTLLFIPQDKLRGFMKGGNGVQGKTGVA